ncbi:MAG: hypothetical protein AB1665_05740 [Candidatus Thermoplasmatota archaeon]
MRLEFPYSKRRLLPSFLAALAMCFGILGLLVLVAGVGFWSLLAFLMLILAVALLLGSPLVSAHLLLPQAFHIRYGLVFRSIIPLDKIGYVHASEETPLRTGVYFSPAGRTIYITTEPRNLVAIGLKERRRFPGALWKSADRIVLSVMKPERLVSVLSRMLGKDLLPPV